MAAENFERGTIKNVGNCYLWRLEIRGFSAESPLIKTFIEGIISTWKLYLERKKFYVKLISANISDSQFTVSISTNDFSISWEISTKESNKYHYLGDTPFLRALPMEVMFEISVKYKDEKVIFEEVLPISKIKKDLAKLLTDEKFSDVTLVGRGGMQFRAHKNILSARSEVFAAMFDNEFLENKANSVSIDDIDGEVLQEMLNYIYTEEIVSKELAADLYVAADKYALVDLQSLCESILTQTMDISSVADILLLAERTSNERLKRNALQFISKNIVAVMETASWKRLQALDHNLCIDVLSKTIKAICNDEQISDIECFE
uniref:BTB domain-containing protein n=1 Tax=Musca domestica TaxID=7370 RepID=A0A1I8MB33_MUSDO